MKSFKIIPCLAAIAMVAGCSSFSVGPDRNAAERAAPAADPFQEALLEGYKAFGANQYAESHYSSADIFYVKARRAAAGDAVLPEDPGNWPLVDADRQTAVELRARLMSWLDMTRPQDPKLAASEQVKYDCWIEETSEGEQPDAENCRPALLTAVAQAAQETQSVVSASCTDPDGYGADGKLCQEGVVYFAFDRYDLQNPGEDNDRKQTVAAQAAALDLIVRQVRSIKPARIDVIGRADAAGPEDYNYGLAECRALSVEDALKRRGLPPVEIRTISLGKTDLIVPTADGVRDPANRVVMVAYQTDRNAPLARQPAPAPRHDLFGCGTARHPAPRSK